MKFMSQLREQVLLHRAWFVAAIIMAAVNVFLAMQLAAVSGRVTTVLVPYDVATAHGEVRVDANHARDAAYLTMLATSDLGNLTNWQGATVKNQIARFLARMTPAYRSAEEHQLVDQAKRNANGDVAQTFFVSSTSVQGTTVRLRGTLERWKKGQPQSSDDVKWTIHYEWNGSMPMIDSIKQSVVKGAPA